MERTIGIIGAGYVGLPLALAFSEHFPVTAYDINSKRVRILKEKYKSTGIRFTDKSCALKTCNFMIVTVPTPLKEDNTPDLECIIKAGEAICPNLKQDDIVVLESTVYPGVTEEILISKLEEKSLKCGRDFKVGYSPERINPGDEKHTIDNIVKVIGGIDEETVEIMEDVYGKICKKGVHKAPSIRVAETAKIIENVQRDINIALINEISIICDMINIDTGDVLNAARTKWNFHSYKPGFPGGHCIGVDTVWLINYCINHLDYHPKVIGAGRSLNESMPAYVTERILKGLNTLEKVPKNSTIYLLGLTFKDNIDDYRNSKAKNLIENLKAWGIQVIGFDPYLDEQVVKREFGIEQQCLNCVQKNYDGIDCTVLFNRHSQFSRLHLSRLKEIMPDKPFLFDLKWRYNRQKAEEKGFLYESL